MKKMRFFGILFLGVMIFGLNVALFAISGSFGNEVFVDDKGKSYSVNKLVLQPEFSIWKFDVGLDLQFYFDEEGDFVDDNWRTSSDIINKILYLKYGNKGDFIYFRLGGLSSASIGHGMIFNRYSNMVRYPEVIKRGLVFDMNFEKFGFETITTNLIKKEVYGGRIYFKPLYDSGLWLLSNLKLAVSGGTDEDLDKDPLQKDDKISVYGADLELPLLDSRFFSATLFGDVAQIHFDEAYAKTLSTDTPKKQPKKNGTGTASGILGKLFMFDYKVEYRNSDQNFIYGYFDTFYDIERSSKIAIIAEQTTPKKEGWCGTLGYSYENKIHILTSYEDMRNDNQNIYPWVHASLALDKSLFFNKLFAVFSYDKKNVSNWNELSDFEKGNTILRTEVGYSINPKTTLVVIQERTYDKNGKVAKRVKFETRIIF